MKHFQPKIVLISSIILLCLVMTSSPIHTSAYLKDGGLTDGDQIIGYYKLYLTNDTVLQESDNVPFTVKTGEGGVIPGFYNHLLGMEVGQSKYGAVVLPADGYLSGDLAGLTLIFDIKIRSLTFDADLSDGDQVAEFKKKDTGIGNALSGVTGVITFAIVALFFGVIAIFVAPTIIAALKPKCVHCGAQADIICGNPTCGTKSCYSCFSKGCPSCKSRKMTPL